MKKFKYLQFLPSYFKKLEGRVYIAIVGGRDVDNFCFVESEFLNLVKEKKLELSDIVIVSGGARGVDSFARQIAEGFDLTLVEIIPDWDKYGKRAGFMRNKEIIKISDIVLAVPGPASKGTWHSIEVAKEMKKEVIIKVYRGEESISSLPIKKVRR